MHLICDCVKYLHNKNIHENEEYDIRNLGAEDLPNKDLDNFELPEASFLRLSAKPKDEDFN